MQVYLPDDLYEVVKDRRLPASEMLQDAVRAEMRRRAMVAASERYTAELATAVGGPTLGSRPMPRLLRGVSVEVVPGGRPVSVRC